VPFGIETWGVFRALLKLFKIISQLMLLAKLSVGGGKVIFIYFIFS